MRASIFIQMCGRVKHSIPFIYISIFKRIISNKPTDSYSSRKINSLVFTIFINIMQLYTLTAFYTLSGFCIRKYNVFFAFSIFSEESPSL